LVNTGDLERTRIENKLRACMIYDGGTPVCVDPSLPILSLIGKKYTMLVLGVIGNMGNRKSFNEILKDIPYSSSTIIARRLKDLQDHNLIIRREGSDGVSYSLTDFGERVRKSLLPLLHTVEKTR
jgi:DNA-binding HxlR family transcriptional regulator